MPTYKSINPEERVYPDLGLTIAPDATVKLNFEADIAGLVLVPSNGKTKSAVSSDSVAVDPQPATEVAPEQGA